VWVGLESVVFPLPVCPARGLATGLVGWKNRYVRGGSAIQHIKYQMIDGGGGGWPGGRGTKHIRLRGGRRTKAPPHVFLWVTLLTEKKNIVAKRNEKSGVLSCPVLSRLGQRADVVGWVCWYALRSLVVYSMLVTFRRLEAIFVVLKRFCLFWALDRQGFELPRARLQTEESKYKVRNGSRNGSRDGFLSFARV